MLRIVEVAGVACDVPLVVLLSALVARLIELAVSPPRPSENFGFPGTTFRLVVVDEARLGVPIGVVVLILLLVLFAAGEVVEGDAADDEGKTEAISFSFSSFT